LWQPYEAAANTYFKADKRPTISETIGYYRERWIGLVMFTVDSEFEIGARRISNNEVAEAAAANAMPGGGLRLKYSNPSHIDDVAVDFPDMTIIIAHPSWPRQDEALSISLHKPNVYIDLCGWSPKYFPSQLVQYANSQLKTKMLLGSDFPLIQPDRWIKDFLEAGFNPEVHDLILKRNAVQGLKLDAAA
jgi:Amidohydrolase